MVRHRVLMLAFVTLALLAACTGPAITPTPGGDAGIQGVVLLGPACPGPQTKTPCPDKPYAATLVVLDQSGSEVARIQSGADGLFRVNVNPGAYTLAPQPPTDSLVPRPPAPIPVTVLAGQYVSVTVTYDSGIR